MVYQAYQGLAYGLANVVNQAPSGIVYQWAMDELVSRHMQATLTRVDHLGVIHQHCLMQHPRWITSTRLPRVHKCTHVSDG